MALVRFNPMRDLLEVEREFNKLFNSFGRRFLDTNGKEELENVVWMPLSDITENKDNYIIKMDIPGLKKDDVKISFSDGQLSVSGERKEEKESNDTTYHRVERTYGKFYRSFNLPQKIKYDKIEAAFNDGQLKITVPKSEEAKPKEIEIKVK
ncbi:MAG TPA: Hsp20/alpha crystallin family protein [Ignavibacteriaceae bacterium]|nr:Hsp20/alpha crystallin family protein [Ignavibacteriaceae bacterium]